MSTKIKTDVAVIGGGPGGEGALHPAVKAGLKTVLIEKESLGGTCLNRGCVPSKAFLSAGHLYSLRKFAEAIGSKISKPDFQKIKEHQKNIVALMQKGLVSSYKKMGVEVITGSASFKSKNLIQVNGIEIEFKNAVIATGSSPIDIFEPAEGIYNSDTIFGINEIPAEIAIIGGGAIGIEMATFFLEMGSAVIVIEALDDILPLEDIDIRATVKRELRRRGVSFKTAVAVESVKSSNGSHKLTLADGQEISAEAVLVAVGRRPNTKELLLDDAGIETDSQGYISVDDYMESSCKGIYGVGDVAGKSLLAYTAHREGAIAVENIIGAKKKLNYEAVPSIIFSNPEVGSIGKTEDELKTAGVEYKKGIYFIRALAKAHAMGETAGMAKVLAGEDGTVLGIHLASPSATEIIQLAIPVIASGMRVDELAGLTFGHPTIAEAITLASGKIE